MLNHGRQRRFFQSVPEQTQNAGHHNVNSEKMKSNIYLISALIMITQSCTTHPDFEAEKKAILLLHDQQRKAHLEKNAELLVGDSLVDFIEVNRGLIRKPIRSESVKMFQAYFNAVEFVKWDDTAPPVISFSDDATMATSVVDKLVIIKRKSDNKLDTVQFAWLAVYKKINGKWQLHRMGSTNR
jgi:hypothetical protein